jgi:hypothetical protein
MAIRRIKQGRKFGVRAKVAPLDIGKALAAAAVKALVYGIKEELTMVWPGPEIVTEVVNAWNLIGDGLYSIRPIAEYCKGRTDVGIAFANNLGGQAGAKQLGDTVPTCFCGETEDVAVTRQAVKVLRLNVSQAFSSGKFISEGFADQLSVRWDGVKDILCTWAADVPREPKQNIVGISPYSQSGKETKALTVEECGRLFSKIEELGALPCIVGDGHIKRANTPTFVATNIENFAEFACRLRLLVTCDNGVGHLGSMLGVRTIVIWKNIASKNFISPGWAPNTTVIDTIEQALALIV